MIKTLKQYLSCKKPYREKRAMVLWKKAYQKRLKIASSSALLRNNLGTFKQ